MLGWPLIAAARQPNHIPRDLVFLKERCTRGERFVMSKRRDHLLNLAMKNSLALVRLWLQNGKLEGNNRYVVGNVRGDPGDSLSIDLSRGIWKDFADPESKGGDLIALCRAIFGLSFEAALTRIEDDLQRLGVLHVAPRAQIPKRSETAVLPVPEGVREPLLTVGASLSTKEADYRLVKWWTYRDGQKRLLFYVKRYDHTSSINLKGKARKKVIPFCYFGEELGWQNGGPGFAKNPLYGLPGLADSPQKPVLVLEGEKACDAATPLFDNYVCVTWMGGTPQLQKADFSPLSGRDITYWRDADGPGESTVPVFSDLMRVVGAKTLKVVELPPGLPPSWDLADEIPPDLDLALLVAEARDVDLSAVTPITDLKEPELLDQFIFTAGTEQFVHVTVDIRFDSGQMDSLYKHLCEKGRMSARLLGSPKLRKVVALTYRPGVVSLVTNDKNGNPFLNTWQPSGIEPVAGDASLLEAHLQYLCPTEVEYTLFADILAFMVQKPGQKLKFAPVLVGRQGTGKSTVATMMRLIVGEHNTTIASTTEIRSGFNEWVAEKQLFIVEEIMALGRIEFMNTLKPLITETTISVNKKYVRRYEIENVANFLFLTNHYDALKLEDGDRRYFVISSEREPQPKEYYNELFSWIHCNLGVIFHWLQARDLSSFNPNERPPMTAGKIRMLKESKDERLRMIEDMIEKCEPPFHTDLIETKKVHAILNSRDGVLAGSSITFTTFLKYLENCNAKNLGQLKYTAFERKSLWLIRNFGAYEHLSDREIVGRYLEALSKGESPF